MSTPDRLRYAFELLSRGKTDEEVERLAGVSLLEVLSLRAAHAAAPARPRGAAAPPRLHHRHWPVAGEGLI